MNEQTTKLIEQLALKLGTTSEYLWSILIKQAPIDATVTLFQMISIMIFGFILWKTHKRLANNDNEGYDKYEHLVIFPMIIGSIIFVILFIICFCCIGDILNGYCNPEYWALDRILHQCNN